MVHMHDRTRPDIALGPQIPEPSVNLQGAELFLRAHTHKRFCGRPRLRRGLPGPTDGCGSLIRIRRTGAHRFGFNKLQDHILVGLHAGKERPGLNGKSFPIWQEL